MGGPAFPPGYDPGRAARRARAFLASLENGQQYQFNVMLARYQQAREALLADIQRITRGVPDASKLPLRQDELLRALDRRLEQYLRVVNAKGKAVARAAQKAGLDTGAVQIAGAGGVAEGVDLNQHAVGALQGVLEDPLSSPLSALGPAVRQRGAQLLSQAVTLGWGPRRVGREMAATMDMARSRAEMIARTEMLRAYREGNLTQWRANGGVVGGWIWQCTPSVRTCPVCFAMSGTFHPLSESLTSHPNCRCTMVPIPTPPPGIDGQGMLDAFTNAIQPGEEQLRRMTVAHQQAILGRARWERWRDGTPLQEMIRDHWHPVYGTQRRLVPLREMGDGPPVPRPVPRPRPTPPPEPPPTVSPGLQLNGDPYVQRNPRVEASEADVQHVTDDALGKLREVGIKAPPGSTEPRTFHWQGDHTPLGDQPQYGGWYFPHSTKLEMNATGFEAQRKSWEAAFFRKSGDLAEASRKALNRARGQFASYIHHEYGHHIDYTFRRRALGLSMDDLSLEDMDILKARSSSLDRLSGPGAAEYRALRKMLDESPTIQNIRKGYVRGVNGPERTANRDYLAKPEEQMARAFAQFMAEETGSPYKSDYTHVQRFVRTDKTQWGPTEFEPIREAMRAWLKASGWMT